MLKPAATYEDLIRTFRWDVPEIYNMGADVSDKWAEADPDRIAIVECIAGQPDRIVTFGDLSTHSNRLAHLLGSAGLEAGDRIAVLLPQCVEVAVSHIAIWKMAGISLPLFKLFGPDALAFRLKDAGVRAVITDSESADLIRQLAAELPALEQVIVVRGDCEDAQALQQRLSMASQDFAPVKTNAEEPVLIIYTSGTTGNPKGALHAHRVLLGHLPGIEMSHNLLPQPGDRMWTPADWAWIGGLMNVLMSALHHGVTVMARPTARFDPEDALLFMQDYQIRNVFMPATALKMLRSVHDIAERFDIQLRSLASGGESLGRELLEWGREVFGLTINEFYGQTEGNMIVSSCADLMPPVPGAMGRVVPGHKVEVIRADGVRCDDGELGMIALRRPGTSMMLRYWNNPGATAAKYVGEWMTTGDLGYRDAEGWLHFEGRDDDVITSSGYRIGPGEIEDCLIRHEAIQLAAVIGKPDPIRTEIVKAFVVLNSGYTASDALKADIMQWVRQHLSAHEYPREVAFVDSLPQTVTGKIKRKDLRAQEGSHHE